jgi:hypothetical protein
MSSNSNVTQTNPNSNATQKRERKLWFAILGSFIFPLILVAFNQHPGITAAKAHSFLSQYYTEIADANQREGAYNNDLTTNFKTFKGHDWQPVNTFWRGQNAPTVDSVIPVPNNPTEFTVRLTYHPKKGDASTETLNFWLQCTGFWRVFAHVPLVPCEGGLKIDIVSKAPPGPSAGS